MTTEEQQLKKLEDKFDAILEHHMKNTQMGNIVMHKVKKCMLDWGDFVREETMSVVDRVLKPNNNG